MIPPANPRLAIYTSGLRVSILHVYVSPMTEPTFENSRVVSYNQSFHITCNLGPVVQSIVSLTASLRRQLVKYMLTTYSST